MTTNFATSGEHASKLAGRSINRERNKPECYRKLRSRSASSTFSTPPKYSPSKLGVWANVLLLSDFHFRPTSSSHKADLIKCTLSNNDHISRVVFLRGGCISFSLSVFLFLSFFPPFLKSLDERSLDENERPRRRSSPLPLPIPREHAAKGRMVEYMYGMENIPASPRIYASRLFTRQ